MSDAFHHPVHKPLEGPKEGVERYKLSASHSVRHRHILRLYDILQHLISLPATFEHSVQSLRAWRALAKCKEVDLRALYQLGGKILERTREQPGGGDEVVEGIEEVEWRQSRRAEWIKWSRNGQHDKVEKLTEYVLALVAAGKPRDALSELELYLPAHPYNTSINLNVLAGYLCLLIAQSAINYDNNSSPPPPRSSPTDSIQGKDDSGLHLVGSHTVDRNNLTSSSPSAAIDYTPFLQMIAQHSPSRVSQAVNHFRRASRLERKNPQFSFGEGARWLEILESSDSTRQLAGKRARAASDDSDSDR